MRAGPFSLLTHHAPVLYVTDPNVECNPYDYAPIDAFINDFPEVWEPATLLATDADGQAAWAQISSSIPTNIQPKGQLDDSTVGVNYDCADDPDCCEFLFEQ